MKRHIIIFVLAILSFWTRDSSAFWGSDTKETASGLNVAEGFDVNTVTTVTGKVMTLPEHKEQEQHTVMTVATTQGTVTVVLGPWWYWEKQTITITKDMDITITGSLAQGKDGTLYIFAQRLENLSTGEIVTLRSESGKSLWSGSGGQNGNRQYGGSGSRSGSGSRGSGARGGRR